MYLNFCNNVFVNVLSLGIAANERALPKFGYLKLCPPVAAASKETQNLKLNQNKACALGA